MKNMSLRSFYDLEITGNVMEMPPLKEPIRSIEKTKVTPINFSMRKRTALNQISKSVTSNRPESSKRMSVTESTKDFKLKNQDEEILRLKKKIEELENQIKDFQKTQKDKEKFIEDLNRKMENVNKQERTLNDKLNELQKECAHLKEENRRFEKNLFLADSLNRDTSEQINKLKLQSEEEIKKLKEEHSIEIKIKEDKLEMLKKQIANAFKDNSWERQMQIEELTKELKRKQEECDSMRQAIKGYKNKFSNSCDNCAHLNQKLDEKSVSNEEKDNLLIDLFNLVKKYQTQPNIQEDLNKLTSKRPYLDMLNKLNIHISNSLTAKNVIPTAKIKKF